MANYRQQRRPTRAPGFDYREPRAYFVTICEHQRVHRFGTIVDREMQRNAAGDMLLATWLSLADKYSSATFDAFVIMPNHVHGIVTLNAPEFVGEAPCGLPRDERLPSLSTIVGWFKTMTTNWYMQGVRQYGWQPFDGRLVATKFP